MCILWGTQRATTTDPLNLLIYNHGCHATSVQPCWVENTFSVHVEHQIEGLNRSLNFSSFSKSRSVLLQLSIVIDIDRVIAPRLCYACNFPPIYAIGEYNRR